MTDQRPFRRARILCTIGPASRDPATLDQMIAAGLDGVRINFSHSSHQEAVDTGIREYLRPKELQNGCPTSASPYFCDYTLNYIRNEPTFGETKRERVNLLKTGGLTIKTTLDPQAQRSSQRQAGGSHDVQ